mmetsp:Transcript_94971/g.268328  ORF Transcript_94971/g.268328 Transcript_94971/m.268328 type:complete len:263 (-) Transcript_94971:42-830(-)
MALPEEDAQRGALQVQRHACQGRQVAEAPAPEQRQGRRAIHRLLPTSLRQVRHQRISPLLRAPPTAPRVAVGGSRGRHQRVVRAHHRQALRGRRHLEGAQGIELHSHRARGIRQQQRATDHGRRQRRQVSEELQGRREGMLAEEELPDDGLNGYRRSAQALRMGEVQIEDTDAQTRGIEADGAEPTVCVISHHLARIGLQFQHAIKVPVAIQLRRQVGRLCQHAAVAIDRQGEARASATGQLAPAFGALRLGSGPRRGRSNG